MTQLIAASISAAPPLRRDAAPPRSPAHSNAPPSADVILERNVFDSVTGSLLGPTYTIDDAPVTPSVRGGPYDVPVCKDASVTAIIASNDDPSWSFAAIQTKEGATSLRRIGDTVASYRVDHIGWYDESPDARPRVWLSGDGSNCLLDLDEAKQTKKRATKKRASKKTKKRKSRRRSNKVPKEILSKIHKISSTEYELDRSVVDDILEKQAILMKSVRMRPGKSGGMKVRGIKRGSLLAHLGLKNGDQLVSINGFDMSDPEKALQAYTRLRTADEMNVQVNRKNKPQSLHYRIK